MRKQRWLGASAALVSLMLVMAACSTPGTSAGQSAAGGSPGGSVAASGFKVCEITDTGGVDDKGFNQAAHEGLLRAETELGTTSALLESTADTDYAPNLATFTDQKCDLIVTVGFLLGSATQASAATNPDQLYAIVDFAYDPPPPNILGLVFDTKSASMLQGYLAAGMSSTGKVGTFGGIQIGPVVDFMNGYAAGIKYYNQQKSKDVKLLGWDPATSPTSTRAASLPRASCRKAPTSSSRSLAPSARARWLPSRTTRARSTRHRCSSASTSTSSSPSPASRTSCCRAS
jgi:basic membrane protein A